jgi:hypothetical protein
MKRADCKTSNWAIRGRRAVNEIEIFIRQERDVGECLVGGTCPQAGKNRLV